MLVSEEWLEGKDARRDGLGRDANPYPLGTRDANAWKRGWDSVPVPAAQVEPKAAE